MAPEGIPLLAHVVASSLARAIKAVEVSEKTAPLSAWKEKWVKKDDDGRRVLKDALYSEKMHTLAEIYKRYRELSLNNRTVVLTSLMLKSFQPHNTQILHL